MLDTRRAYTTVTTTHAAFGGYTENSFTCTSCEFRIDVVPGPDGAPQLSVDGVPLVRVQETGIKPVISKSKPGGMLGKGTKPGHTRLFPRKAGGLI